MMPRLLTSALLLLVLAASSAQAMIFVQIPNIGDCSVEARDVAALTTALHEAARLERPGRLEFHLACDGRASAHLSRLEAARTPLAALAIEFRDTAQGACYLKYKLDRCFIKSWSTSGDADGRSTGDKGTLVLQYDRATIEPSR
jgi:hypothetical protein